MDSLTQITLGAACGELALGKKIGNRAMMWGAIGGTIPDLDILANFMLTDVEALAFHRGISHSILFGIVSPFLFAWLTNRLYGSGLYQKKWYRGLIFMLSILFLIGVGLIVNVIPVVLSGDKNWVVILLSVSALIWLGYRLWQNFQKDALEEITVKYSDWVKLFFWSIFTHPLLDAFTAYGTQLFAPFSDYRVAFNTISVVDPLYTVPFILSLLGAAMFLKTHRFRKYLTILGVVVSSTYLAFTVYNKQRIDQIFEQSLTNQNINYQRFRTSPSIFNNILWQGVAETEDAYMMGMYSLFDASPKVSFYTLQKQHELLHPYESEKPIQILKWFTDDYYTVTPLSGGTFQLSDVRYGSVKEQASKPEDFVFRFIINPKPEGIEVKEIRARENVDESFADLFRRIKGK